MQNWFLMMLGTCCQASVSASFCGSFQSILAKTKVDFKPRQHIEKEWMIWFATRSAMHCNADVAQHLYVAYRVHWCCEAALFFDSHWCLWKLRLTLARTFCFDHVLYTWSPFGLNIRPWSEIRCVWWQNRPPCDRLIASSQCFYVSFCLTFATCVGAKQYTARMPAPRCQKNNLYSPIQLFCAWPSNRLLTFISQNWPCRVARSIALTDGIVLHRRAGIWESFAEGVVEPSWDL